MRWHAAPRSSCTTGMSTSTGPAGMSNGEHYHQIPESLKAHPNFADLLFYRGQVLAGRDWPRTSPHIGDATSTP